jgi:hypothetical protein
MRLRSIFQISFLSVILCSSAFAQTGTTPPATPPAPHDTIWHHELVASLNLTQVSFTHWQAGGINALAYAASIVGKSVRNDTNTTWTNSYKFAFGQTEIGNQGIRTSDDELNLESMLTYKLGTNINPYADVSFASQFAPGYQYADTGAGVEVSNFLDPAFIKESAGMGWVLSKAFQTRLGVGVREIITNLYNQYAADPSEPGIHKTRIEGGFESVSQLQLQVDDNVLFKADLDLFDPIKTLDRVVVHADASIVAKVSKWFSAQIAASFINEPDISPFTQIQEGISIGINYALF